MRVITTLVGGGFLVACLQVAAAQGPSPTSSAIAISGRVVVDATGDPVPNARVSLTPSTLGTAVVLTDGDGRFAVTVASSGVEVTASKTGFASTSVTSTSQPTVEIRLRRGGVISGTVVDEFGEPVSGYRVVAEVPSSSVVNPPAVRATLTDDRGQYRLTGLGAGTFVVASIDPFAPVSFGGPIPRMYLPRAATPAQAEPLRLQFGEERDRIDFVVAAEQPVLPPTPANQAAGNALERGTAIVRGRIADSSGRPVAHALVMVREISRLQERVVGADASGRFVFRNLPAGTFRVITRKRGYSTIAADDGGLPSVRTLDVIDGRSHDDVDLGLRRGVAVSGQVVDELGEPLEGASVQAMQVRYERGRRRLAPVGTAQLTDDSGGYRLHGLLAGEFVVSATVGAVGSGDVPGYARSYFPGTPNPSAAQFVSVGASQEVTGIDVAMSRTRTARVAGTILDSAGQPARGGSLTLQPSLLSNAVTAASVGARTLPDGRFEFPNVVPGQYVIQADRGRVNGWTEGEFGTLAVSVDGTDVTGLVLQTSSGSSISGRVRFETFRNTQPPAVSAIVLSPIPVDVDLSAASYASARLGADWTFELDGLNGPRRLQVTRAPAEWALKEILVSRIDVTDRPLPLGRSNQSLRDVEVVLTDRINDLRGTITDEQSRPVPASTVIVFATDRERWYQASRFLRHAQAASDGSYELTGLPAASYYAAAVPRPPQGTDAWQDAEFLESLIPRASTFTLGDTQRSTVNLRVSIDSIPRR